MMIKFNNAHPDHRGNVIWLNTDQIIAVYENAEVTGGSLSTKIFCISNTLYTVEESLSEAIKLIRDGMPFVPVMLNEENKKKKIA